MNAEFLARLARNKSKHQFLRWIVIDAGQVGIILTVHLTRRSIANSYLDNLGLLLLTSCVSWSCVEIPESQRSRREQARGRACSSILLELHDTAIKV